MTVQEILVGQREFFNTGSTRSVSFRKNALKKLRMAIINNENQIAEALKKDLNKSGFESYMTEIGIVLDEIKTLINHLSKWSAARYVKTPLAQFYGRSFILPEPYGVVLIMSPWNYPFQLSIAPLVGAIAAGNCVILKPSAYAPNVSRVMADLLTGCFPPKYVRVIQGGRKENTELLDQKFDYIFFTGGVEVGKLVMEKAAKHLTPISLELGGKSPCIVDKTADLDLAAKRIAFGKFINSGQTCVAPDYLYVQEEIKEKLVNLLNKYIKVFFGENPLDNPDYPKIINEKHYKRIIGLIEGEHILTGGYGIIKNFEDNNLSKDNKISEDDNSSKNKNTSEDDTISKGNNSPEVNKLSKDSKSYEDNYNSKITDTENKVYQIAPTILDGIIPDSKIMQEEIFGPVLPIMTYKNIKEVTGYVNSRPKPLALYLFTTDKKTERSILKNVSFGGGCINDTIIHLATPYMGFGGVGESGMGSYHGKYSFETFSHMKSIVKKANWIDLPMRYHPYTKENEKLIRFFLR
ncbi:aldehyde dehydrogenase [Anaerocolumna sp. MB42-C2]|uniref:aldehyde dehydrogenase n=1 Tax=Anaerocolumna sp. MB42-C2 TaxID=3070997 RepID=UPI0027E0F5D2|nr:aldehyde dehydrogenase [Anaerocolumna sp. MB42-C2]WMJ86265.1 aldehyde dehydrogenase [Anaerocolumna sp. MB42-C2]